TDHAHLTTHHVEELWKLIDSCLADERAHRCDTGVALLSPARSTIAFRIRTHAAKLEQHERLPPEAHAALMIEHRRAPTVFELDGQRSEQHDRQRQAEHDEARAQIQGAGAEAT